MPATSLVLPAVLGGVAAGILAADSVALVPLPLLGGIALTGSGSRSGGGRCSSSVSRSRPSVSARGGARPRSRSEPDRPRWRAWSTATSTRCRARSSTTRGRARTACSSCSATSRPRRTARSAGLGDRLLVWLPRGVDAGAGDRLLVISRIELAEDFDGFAYREYLARQGIAAIARADSAEVIGEASGPTAVLAGLRSTLLGGLNDLVPEPEAALGAGILLGVRSAIAPEINDAFATAGLTHVVAISGWNIAIVAALVAAAVRPLAQAPRRAMDHRGSRRHDGWRLRPPHRRESVRRPRRAHGRGNARRPPRRLSRPRGVGAGPRGARHAAGRSAGAVGRRVPALAARDGRPRLLRGSRSSAACTDGRAGSASRSR